MARSRTPLQRFIFFALPVALFSGIACSAHETPDELLIAGLLVATSKSSPANTCTATGAAFDTLPSKKILFIGNSLTFYNDGVYSKLGAMSSSLEIDEVASGRGGYCLGPVANCWNNHWRDYQNNTEIKTLIDGGGYDYFVLQEQSQFPFFLSVAHFSNIDDDWAPLIQATSPGARILLFMSWEHDATPGMTTAFLKNQFESVESGIDANHGDISDVVYIGSAFDATSRQDGLELKSDAIHPNANGTYLAAVSLFHRIYPEVTVDQFKARFNCDNNETDTLIDRGFADYSG